MLTDKPNIVIAKPPKRIRHERKAAAIPTRIVDNSRKTEPMSEDERDRRADAADRLFQEIKRAVAGG